MTLFTNPLLTRLTAKPSRLSARVCFWLAFGLGVSTLLVSTQLFLADHNSNFRTPIYLLPMLFAALAAAVPPIVALIAGSLTARNVSDGSYELLTTTTLSDASIVQGYVFAALYRARGLLALAVGLAPPLVVGMLDSALHASLFLCRVNHFYHTGDYNPRMDYSVCAMPSASVGLTWLLIALGLWGLNLLAAALGVGLALRWRNPLVVATFAPLAALLLPLSFFWHWQIPNSLKTLDVMLWLFDLTLVDAAKWQISFLFMLAPYALTLALLHSSQRWTRLHQ
ncbi:MAG: hypothetical protein HYZ49_06610 [Chloroflexi bacterium]|nr:hypothetical protein [Chloroflexota bacterium]